MIASCIALLLTILIPPKYERPSMPAIQPSSQEPISFLAKKMWQFADGVKLSVGLATGMLVISRIIELCNPLIFAQLIGEVSIN
jgi:hypothetical protein